MNSDVEMKKTSPVLPPKRRRFTRVDVSLAVEYTFISSSGERLSGQPLEGTSRDISGGGCLLEGTISNLEWIPDLLIDNMKMNVKIHFPEDGLIVNTKATVAWIEPDDPGEETFQLGLEFDELQNDKRHQIVDFVIRETTPDR